MYIFGVVSETISISKSFQASDNLKVQSNGAIIAGFFGFLTSNNSSTLLIPCVISQSKAAIPQPWKVRIVS